MPAERHFELPAAPNLEFYRKQAKDLHHAFGAAADDAVARVEDVLGSRARQRFLLSDAQYVLAQEHGFASWADFRRAIESPAESARPVRRIGASDEGPYEARARALLERLHNGSPDAERRVRTFVPRFAAVDSLAGLVELRDARLAVAREMGFRTWRELVFYTRRAVPAGNEETDDNRRLVDLWQAAKDQGLRRVLRDQPDPAHLADQLLHLLAQHDPFGTGHHGQDDDLSPAVVDVLAEYATDLDVPMQIAASSDRADLVTLLLDAGAALDARTLWGATALEVSIYKGCVQSIDALAARGIVPFALWTVAACGRLDLVRACFDASGDLRPEAGVHRPNPTGDGWPPRPAPTDDPGEIVAEAFVHACGSGRTEVVEWFLDQGVDASVCPYYGMTGLHSAIAQGLVDVVRLLLERGASVHLRDERFDGDAFGWASHFAELYPADPARSRIRALVDAGAKPVSP